LSELARSNAELEAFTYSVSHDLKEPLRTIEAFSQFLLEDYQANLDDQGRDYLQKLASASARMKHLIEDLLALSRIGRRDVATSTVDVGRIVADVVEGMRATIEERGAEVRVDPDLPGVRADAARIEQIFGNLIANGIKFNRSEHPSIEVGVRGQGGETAAYFVRDNGIGIEPAYHERIFGIFQRLHRREEFEGTGAGLAIVKRAVESLGGTVEVESDGAAGTTFVVTLPTAEPRQADERAAA
ncbi:MAG TPA: ATP-binding protein, partial [Dehalococcoidia bacterium]|nr:ATP-binding protein [Dehalococcoidia bacterium]